MLKAALLSAITSSSVGFLFWGLLLGKVEDVIIGAILGAASALLLIAFARWEE